MGALDYRLKALLFAALGSGFVVRRRLAAIRASGKVTILNLHRVSQDDGSGYRPLDPRLFEELLTFLKRNFVLILFSELDLPSAKPKAIISFDDGYKDFIEVAAPVLARHKVRVNQNIIPECVETQLPPLNVLAQDFVGKAPRELTLKLDIPGFGDLHAPDLASRLSSFIKNKPQSEQKKLAETLKPQFFEWDRFSPTRMMTREDLRQIAAEHELGAHSYSHASMGYESCDYLKEDILRCRRYFEEALEQLMRIYAFPNGSFRDGQIELVQAAGVEHVLLVGDDFSDGRSPHKRFGFDARSWSEAKFKALGGLREARA